MRYYYCTASTFTSIVRNKTLWLSDMTQSNDSYEIVNFVKIVRAELDAKAKALKETLPEPTPRKGSRGKQFSEALERISVYQRAAKKLDEEYKKFYCLAICFSDRGDSLSQWRGYGDDGCGISIGFDEDRLRELSEKHKLFKYREVRYYRDAADELIRERIRAYTEALDAVAAETKDRTRERTDALAAWATKVLDDDAPFLKPNGFIEEAETRFCYVRLITPNQMAAPKENSNLSGIDFRVGGTAIIPYFKLALEDAEGRFMSDVIREVRIGPCNDSEPAVILSMLAKYGFDYLNIKVSKSGIPYRKRR